MGSRNTKQTLAEPYVSFDTLPTEYRNRKLGQPATIAVPVATALPSYQVYQQPMTTYTAQQPVYTQPAVQYWQSQAQPMPQASYVIQQPYMLPPQTAQYAPQLSRRQIYSVPKFTNY